MKLFTKKATALFLSLGVMTAAFAESKVEVKLGNVTANCDANEVFVDVQLRNDGNRNIDLTSMNIRFNYNKAALSLTGLGDKYYNAMGGESGHSWLEQNNAATYGLIEYEGINELRRNDNDWSTAAQLKFDVIDFSESVEITLNDQNQFPKTVVTELADARNMKYEELEITRYIGTDIALAAVCMQPITSGINVTEKPGTVVQNNPSAYTVCQDETVEFDAWFESNNKDLRYNWNRSSDLTTISNLNAANPTVSGWATPGTYTYVLEVKDPYFEDNTQLQEVVLEVESAETCNKTATSINTLDAQAIGLQIAPNPTTGKFTIDFDLLGNNGADIVITDLAGSNVVATAAVEGNGNAITHSFDLTGEVAAGTYIVSVITESYKVNEQLIVVR